MKTMERINSVSLTPAVNAWLADSRHPRILHIFDHACNLINEEQEVLSIVTPQIGNGPFNLVIEDDVLFSEQLNVGSPVAVSPSQLILGDLTINIMNANLWNPRPNWEKLHTMKDDVLESLAPLRNPNHQPSLPNSLLSALATSVATADINSSFTATRQLAGLGIGLTPAGDDFIMGAILAAWIVHPTEVTNVIANKIANIAAPLTTSLSGAWLRSAGRGEAGILWHELFDALIAGEKIIIQLQVNKILAIGETSGADALAGFLRTIQTYITLLSRKEATLSGE